MRKLIGMAIFLVIVIGGLWIVSRVMLVKAVTNGSYMPSQATLNSYGVQEVRAPFRQNR